MAVPVASVRAEPFSGLSVPREVSSSTNVSVIGSLLLVTRVIVTVRGFAADSWLSVSPALFVVVIEIWGGVGGVSID